MDMSMDDGMTLASGSMMPYLHFTRGDILWFAGWVPQSSGALAGACIGLFILTLVERWLAAVRRLMEAHWADAGRAAMKKKGCDEKNKGKSTLQRMGLRAPPFIPAHDVMRGAMHALQTLLGFAFMLAVMCVVISLLPFHLMMSLTFSPMSGLSKQPTSSPSSSAWESARCCLGGMVPPPVGCIEFSVDRIADLRKRGRFFISSDDCTHWPRGLVDSLYMCTIRYATIFFAFQNSDIHLDLLL
jgi:hypothetical protein